MSITQPPASDRIIVSKLLNLKLHGCPTSGGKGGITWYADDIILLSPSVNGLQSMRDVCSVTSQSLFLNFNCSKSASSLVLFLNTTLLICFYVVIKLRGLTQLNIWASYISLVNGFQLTMALLKENDILPVTVYLLTAETKKNCYKFSYFNRIACQYYLLTVLLL